MCCLLVLMLYEKFRCGCQVFLNVLWFLLVLMQLLMFRLFSVSELVQVWLVGVCGFCEQIVLIICCGVMKFRQDGVFLQFQCRLRLSCRWLLICQLFWMNRLICLDFECILLDMFDMLVIGLMNCVLYGMEDGKFGLFRLQVKVGLICVVLDVYRLICLYFVFILMVWLFIYWMLFRVRLFLIDQFFWFFI